MISLPIGFRILRYWALMEPGIDLEPALYSLNLIESQTSANSDSCCRIFLYLQKNPIAWGEQAPGFTFRRYLKRTTLRRRDYYFFLFGIINAEYFPKPRFFRRGK